MIYYHRKYFDEMKRALDKQKQIAMLHDDSRIVEQAKSLVQNPSKKQIGGNFFYTNVDYEKQSTPTPGEGMEEQHADQQQEDAENQEIETNMQQGTPCVLTQDSLQINSKSRLLNDQDL